MTNLKTQLLGAHHDGVGLSTSPLNVQQDGTTTTTSAGADLTAEERAALALSDVKSKNQREMG